MITDAVLDEGLVDNVRALLRSMEAGDVRQASALMDEVVMRHDVSLFNEIGKITRQLHDTMQAFQFDDRVVTMAQSDIPDARTRLNYVVAMTEQAANRVLTSVEESIPIAEELERSSRVLRDHWGRSRHQNMSPDEFRAMAHQIDTFLSGTEGRAARLRKNLSDVLMAQDFQDITGQIIRRVITLVQEIEEHLVDLLRITGQRRLAKADERVERKVLVSGPAVPGVDKGDRVHGQDDVDNLLSSLGF